MLKIKLSACQRFSGLSAWNAPWVSSHTTGNRALIGTLSFNGSLLVFNRAILALYFSFLLDLFDLQGICKAQSERCF